MKRDIFCRNLELMEEQKTLKFIDWNGQEKTWIFDSSLNGVAERMKVPKKYQDFEEVHWPAIEKFLKEKGWL